MLEAAIFDMDGVLSDSEPFYERAVDLVMGRYGVEVPPEVKFSLHGVPNLETWEILAGRYSPPATATELLAMEQVLIDGWLGSGEIPPVPFAFALIRNLKESGVKIAVATSNFSYRASRVVEQNGAESLVDIIIGGESVKNNKPAPDIFLFAAERLRVKPENCVVFEDSPYGVTAALAAGMKVAQYANPDGPLYGDCGAGLVLGTFENITTDYIEKALWP